MTRLVWKDILAARWLLMAGLPIYLVQLITVGWIEPLFLGATLLFTVFMAFGSILIEELQGTETLWCSLPVTRREIVLARYLTALIGSALGLAFSRGVAWLLQIAGPLPGGRQPADPGLAAYVILFLLLSLIAAFFLPFAFRHGAGKGSLMFAAFGMGGIILASALAQAALYLAGLSNPMLAPEAWTVAEGTSEASVVAWLDRWGPVLLACLAAVTAFALTISAGLSRQFYEARDL